MNARPTHPLETWARQVFGADFATVLLHGLSDKRQAAEGRVWAGRAAPQVRQAPTELLITPPGSGWWGRKPLVLAALFRLLVARPEIDRILNFTFIELLGVLMRRDIPASWRGARTPSTFTTGAATWRRAGVLAGSAWRAADTVLSRGMCSAGKSARSVIAPGKELLSSRSTRNCPGPCGRAGSYSPASTSADSPPDRP